MDQLKREFQNFCESTSIHGYGYLFIANSLTGKIFFSLVILSLSCSGCILFAYNYAAYSKSTLITTIETTSAPLSEATFTSITVCNFNQLEASFLSNMQVYDNREVRNLLVKKYIDGHKEPLTQHEEEMLLSVEENFWLEFGNTSLYSQGRQWCRDLFIHIKFENQSLAWSSMLYHDENNGLGPYLYVTDFGACCFLSPHHDLNWKEGDFYNLNATAKHGEQNGLSILFDVEQFNYGHIKGNAAGLKIAFHHHLDMPMMQFSSQRIQSGSEYQVIIKPEISVTTENAIQNLKPRDRQCYIDGENNLTALHSGNFFRYQVNNCLVDEGILKIYWDCRCKSRLSFYDPYSEILSECTGQKLYCENEIIKTMGLPKEERTDSMYEFMVQEALDNFTHIGNLTKPAKKICLPACRVQENNNIMSSAQFPPDQGFFNQPYFCFVASHILQATCYHDSRRFFADKKYPNLCKILEEFDTYFGEYSEIDCNDWPIPYFSDGNIVENHTLTREVLNYGKANLALVHIFFQSPYITKMKRDVEMNFTEFVANTGGLLGLCLGFSFVSIFEILYWFCRCFTCKY